MSTWSGAQASAVTSPSSYSASATINLSQEYTLAIQTDSYNEIWSKIAQQPDADADAEEEEEGDGVLGVVLQPDRASIEQALREAPNTNLTHLVSCYLDSSERTSLLCLSFRRSIRRARSLYAAIADLLDLLPSSSPPLTLSQCGWAFDTFLHFDRIDNPFPSASPSSDFHDMRRSFLDLKEHLDLRLLRARRRLCLLRCATRGSGIFLVACTVGIAVAGLVLATHAMAALLAAAPACIGGCSCSCPPPTLEHLQDHMDQLDAAARGTYVLNNDLDTIERLVARLHATVESDKMLVRLGLERGRGQRHSIEEVVRQLRKNHPSLVHQLTDLEEHICLYFAAVNRARSLLLRHIHVQPPFS